MSTTKSNTNYHRKLEELISKLDRRPKLLLHSCCAPCSSYCLIYLLPYFDITCFFYNPNITDRDEYDKRLAELYRLCEILSKGTVLSDTFSLRVIEGDYEPGVFTSNVEERGLTGEPEGGRRCDMCFRMRLQKTYETALAAGADYFATTLTISPHKNAQLINEIGYSIDKDMWLPADFKKNDGYKRSIELSAKYDLYRQNYCGCWLSRRDVAAGGAPFERGRCVDERKDKS